MSEHTSNDKIIAIGLLILLALYFCLVQSALDGPFVFDDFPNLENLQILNNGFNSQSLGHYLAAFIGSPGRPIAALSFLINDYAWPSYPYGFKYTNVMIHLLNGVLLFGLLRQLAKASPALPQSLIWPLLAMAAWLFHPLQLSAQMLVVQRMTLLSATFCFLGIWGYIALLQRARTTPGGLAALSVLGFCTILAFLSKENGALLPVLAWVLNATLLHGLLASKPLFMRRLIDFCCIMPSLVVFGAMLYIATRPGTFLSRDFNLPERLMTQIHVLADYMYHILMPRLSGSGIYFDDYPVIRSWTQPISTLLLALCFLASLMFAIIKRNRFPLLSFAILWFFAGHAMESSILDLELYFEHRNYLPLLGPVVTLSTLAFAFTPRRAAGIGLFSLWLTLLITITALQAPVWGDAQRLVYTWASEKPHSLRATQELARYHYDAGNPQAAVDILLRAQAKGMAYADLPLSLMLAKCWQPQVSIEADPYRQSLLALKSAPFTTSTLSSLKLLRQSAQNGQCPETIDGPQWLELSEVMLAQPKYRVLAAGNIHTERANYFIAKRDLSGTMREFEAAYEAAPSVPLSLRIAEVLISAGLLDEAEAWITKGMSAPQPLFDRLMYDQTVESRRLLAILADARKTQSLRQSSTKDTPLAGHGL
jgi:hypothetical protein